MTRKLTVIFVLALLFGTYLIISPYLDGDKMEVTITDRLPDSDFMATADVFQVAKEVSGMLYYYNVGYRDFLSPEFILSQAKNYGLDLQSTSYVFANKNGEFGLLIPMIDSSRIENGITKLRHFFNVKDIEINKEKVLKLLDHNAYLFYGNDYICYYKGDNIKTNHHRITEAKANQISPYWIDVINQKKYLDKSILICSRLSDFKEVNIDQVVAYPTIDSTHIYFTTYLASKDTLPIKLKPGGMDLVDGEFTKQSINLHLDPTYLKAHPNHPFVKYLMKQSARIRFPIKEFLERWDGDISFQQGGWITVMEQYVESELDDDFNVTEVVKTKEAKVPGFAVYYTISPSTMDFVEIMKKRGFLTLQEEKYHLLLSPPLNLQVDSKQNTHLFYATKGLPKMKESQGSYIMWNHKGTQYNVQIDSVNTFELYATMSFSMKQLLSPKNLKSTFN